MGQLIPELSWAKIRIRLDITYMLQRDNKHEYKITISSLKERNVK